MLIIVILIMLKGRLAVENIIEKSIDENCKDNDFVDDKHSNDDNEGDVNGDSTSSSSDV